MPYNILCFRSLYFMSLIVLYFLHCTSVLSFNIDVVLTLSILILLLFISDLSHDELDDVFLHIFIMC